MVVAAGKRQDRRIRRARRRPRFRRARARQSATPKRWLALASKSPAPSQTRARAVRGRATVQARATLRLADGGSTPHGSSANAGASASSGSGTAGRGPVLPPRAAQARRPAESSGEDIVGPDSTRAPPSARRRLVDREAAAFRHRHRRDHCASRGSAPRHQRQDVLVTSYSSRASTHLLMKSSDPASPRSLPTLVLAPPSRRARRRYDPLAVCRLDGCPACPGGPVRRAIHHRVRGYAYTHFSRCAASSLAGRINRPIG